MMTLSNSLTPPTVLLPEPPQPSRQVDGTCRGSYGSGGGWVGNIDSNVYCTWIEEREGGQRRFPYKANSRPISSHVLSGDVGIFFPFYIPHSFFSCFHSHSLFHFYSVKRVKKTRSKKVVLPAVNRERRGTDSSLEDRPESRDIPQCS